MTPRRAFTDEERRGRLVVRHHLARTATNVEEAVEAVVASHSTDPVTPYLAAWARVPGVGASDLDRALYEDRTLWRLHAMRRTLFVVPVAAAGVIQQAASAEVARRERQRLEGWLAAEMDPAEVPAWLAAVEDRTLEVLADGRARRTQDLTAAVPELATPITLGSGRWTATSPLSSRLLFLLAMDGRIVRTRPAGSWRSSQYHWVATEAWFDGRVAQPAPGPQEPAAARGELARRYLASHGPATLVDLRWWTGWTAAQARAALETAGAVAVAVDGGEAYVVADDLDSPEPRALHATLLPGLDSTPMGYKERGWFLAGDHVKVLFDRNGNAGPTVWVGGRVVGGWGQRPDGEVVYRLLEDIGAQATDLVAAEAAALTAWLDGVTVSHRFRSPLERELAG